MANPIAFNMDYSLGASETSLTVEFDFTAFPAANGSPQNNSCRVLPLQFGHCNDVLLIMRYGGGGGEGSSGSGF